MRLYGRLSALLFAVLLAVIAATFRQYGVGWDEESQREYGALVHKFYATYFDANPDVAALNYKNLRLYGGLFDVVGFEANRVLPFGEFESRHLWNAIVGLLGVLGCSKAAGVLGGPAAAFWAALLLILTPTYYGHMFNNPKDIPFAVGYIWSLYYLLRVLQALPRVPLTLALRLGLAIGATLAIRAGGFLLFGYVAAVIGVYLVAQSIVTRRVAFGAALWSLLSLAIVAAASYVVMLLFWPFAAAHPLAGPFKALRELTHFRYYETIRFDGVSIHTKDMPWFYLPKYLLIQLPELVLVLLAAGLALAIGWLARGRLVSEPRLAGGVLLLVVAAAFPVGYIIVEKSVVYDAARHVLFVVPPFVCLAGLTLASLIPRATTLHPIARFGAAFALLALVQAPVRAMVALHPYQYVYFNALIGGLPGAASRYETDYWGQCYREAVICMTDRLAREAGEGKSSGPFLVYVIRPWRPATYFFPSHLEWTREVRKADFGISFTRYDSQTAFANDQVYVTVERLGTPRAHQAQPEPAEDETTIPLPAWRHDHVHADIVAFPHVGDRQRWQQQLHLRSVTRPNRDLAIVALDVSDPAGDLMTDLPAWRAGRFSDHNLLSPRGRDRGGRDRPLTCPTRCHAHPQRHGHNHSVHCCGLPPFEAMLPACHRSGLAPFHGGCTAWAHAGQLPPFIRRGRRLLRGARQPIPPAASLSAWRTRCGPGVSGVGAEFALVHLGQAFGGWRVVAVTADVIARYVRQRLDAGAAGGTINYELACLKRALKRGQRAGRVGILPHVALLALDSIRQGFFERSEFEALLGALDDPTVRAAATIGYITGWRLQSEILTRQRHHVDLDGGWVRLQPGESKTREGRNFPLTPELHDVLSAQLARVHALELALGQVVPWLFPGPDGARLQPFRKAWRTACRTAGLGHRLIHDFRRTALRNLERAGVPRSAAMKMIGHRTESIYRRYAIADETMLKEGALKLAAFHDTDRQAIPKLVVFPVRGRKTGGSHAPVTGTDA